MKPIYHEDRISVYILSLAVIGFVSLAFLSISWAWGFLLGTAIATLAFRLLVNDVRNLTSRRSPAKTATIGYVKRYVLYGGSMAVALTNPQISFVAVVMGLLVPKVLILFLTLIVRRTSVGG